MRHPSTSILILFTLLGLSALACGGAPTPDAAAPGADTCVTPEGASAAAPPECGAGCEWKPDLLRCGIKRGIIVDDQAPPPPTPPPPPESS